MAHSNPKHPDQTPTNAQLKSALTLIAAEIARDPLRSSFLSKIMRDTSGGSDANRAKRRHNEPAVCIFGRSLA